VRIQVSPEGVEVVVPRRMALREVEPFVAEKRPWVERTLRRMRAAEAEHPPPRLEDGGRVPYLGEELVLRLAVEPGRARAHVARRGADLHVRVGAGDPDAARVALERWYRRRAQTEIAPRLDAAATRAGRSYARLAIRGQRSRWASCSPTGTMSFNWRLLLAPAEVLDYVVEHEVAHLDVADHSQRFWSLLAARRPGYRAEQRWLREHGQSLRF
jgi:predicted metal-dependent hydrolase